MCLILLFANVMCVHVERLMAIMQRYLHMVRFVQTFCILLLHYIEKTDHSLSKVKNS